MKYFGYAGLQLLEADKSEVARWYIASDMAYLFGWIVLVALATRSQLLAKRVMSAKVCGTAAGLQLLVIVGLIAKYPAQAQLPRTLGEIDASGVLFLLELAFLATCVLLFLCLHSSTFGTRAAATSLALLGFVLVVTIDPARNFFERFRFNFGMFAPAFVLVVVGSEEILRRSCRHLWENTFRAGHH